MLKLNIQSLTTDYIHQLLNQKTKHVHVQNGYLEHLKICMFYMVSKEGELFCISSQLPSSRHQITTENLDTNLSAKISTDILHGIHNVY